MPNSTKLSDFEERNAMLAQTVMRQMEEARIEAVDKLSKSLANSAEELISLTKFSAEEAVEAQSANVRLSAIKHHLKLAGLEVERSEVSHTGGLTISSEHAAKVLDAARDK